MKTVDRVGHKIDYKLNILGIRVRETSCQLIAKGDGRWSTIGPRWDLPVHVPRNPQELKEVATDTLRVTAYQYMTENRTADLADVLAKRKDFERAMQEEDAISAAS